MNNLVILIITAILVLLSIIFIDKEKKKTKIHNLFLVLNVLLIIYIIGLILQIVFSFTKILPVEFEKISFIGMALIPVVTFLISITFLKGNISIRKFSAFFVIPIISILIIWFRTDWIFVKYSTELNEIIYGLWFTIFTIYIYILYAISFIILIYTSIIKSGFLSKQTFFMVLAGIVPIIINVLGILKIINMTVYITPMTFSFTSVCIFVAIFKYKALNIIPIAFRTVINTMSDAFIVISDDGSIVDKNLTFDNIFNEVLGISKKDNFFTAIEKNNIIEVDKLKKHIAETRKKSGIVQKEYHIVAENFDKYFEVDLHPIKAKYEKQYVGTLLLFKDITQHKKDIEIIEAKQEVIVKQGQLVSIGELAGGVAHDINTPISAIKTGLQLFSEMYDPRDDTEINLLFRMNNCADKIIRIVNSMRNQIRNLGSDQMIVFKVSDVINDVKIIAYHEIQRNKCELIVNIEDDLSVYGDPTKLGQVFTNLLLNAIQAYGENGGKIEISVIKAPENKIMIMVRDFAGGIPDTIKDYVFKNILTTKGTKGTGLGLYLAYSVIKGEFSGEITFESEIGGGTTFYVFLNKEGKQKKKENIEENEEMKNIEKVD